MKLDAIILSKILVRLFIIVALLIALIGVSSNIYSPYTTLSQVQMSAINVKPLVLGNVTNVFVENGEYVKEGELLYTIDKTDYSIALSNSKADLVRANTELLSLKYQLDIQRSDLSQQKSSYNKSFNHYKRFQQLFLKKSISSDDYETAKNQKEQDYFAIKKIESEIIRTKNEIGEDGKNASVLKAKSSLVKASVNLDRTDVRAGGSGIISNLQITKGDYIGTEDNSLIIVDEQSLYLSANFNEKGLSTIHVGSKVSIVFDGYPGQIYSGLVTSVDRAIQGGVGQVGQLSEMDSSDRWVRRSEQFPVRINIIEPPENLIAGSKATVMLSEQSNSFWNAVSSLTMKFMAFVRYVY
ncbi:secretion protein [Vibrio inusitatus NBRC 102082]|uniref:Secretion protein n=1 Tax=Vibrio inusitatus NBRC 102082 TaxID=1219070 RepID=A0A4Y3HXL4_9VIBR|nr:HlyD family secretion protein [Vibrio inusitatus]GEA51827.1 secretion protein [Vibrio inusitatus NBRC 102082]